MAKRTHEAISSEIVDHLDIVAEYQSLGVKMARSEPRVSGKMPCFAVDRDERNPSAYIDVKTGRYGDSKTGLSNSLWDFAAQHGRLPIGRKPVATMPKRSA